jgi:hypothetical protein
VLTLAAYWGPIGFLATQGFRFFVYGEAGHIIKVKHESLILRFSLWEWLLFWGLMMTVILFVLLLPASQKSKVSG